MHFFSPCNKEFISHIPTVLQKQFLNLALTMTLQASPACQGPPFTGSISFTIPHTWKLQLTLPLLFPAAFLHFSERELFIPQDQPLLSSNAKIYIFSYGESKL